MQIRQAGTDSGYLPSKPLLAGDQFTRTAKVVAKNEFERRSVAYFRCMLTTGFIAGLAGGTAEIIWITLYKAVSVGDAAAVARSITETLFPNAVPAAAMVPLGIAIHMGLAIALGIAIAILVRSAIPRAAARLIEPVVVIGLLVCIWATNFFVVAPAINPGFVALVPYAAGLTSKILFGGAAAFMLQLIDGPYPAKRQDLKGAV